MAGKQSEQKPTKPVVDEEQARQGEMVPGTRNSVVIATALAAVALFVVAVVIL